MSESENKKKALEEALENLKKIKRFLKNVQKTLYSDNDMHFMHAGLTAFYLIEYIANPLALELTVKNQYYQICEELEYKNSLN